MRGLLHQNDGKYIDNKGSHIPIIFSDIASE
jgi:hypothetical protein